MANNTARKKTLRNRNHRVIYMLRAQCEVHGLDKMITFYRIPNASANAMYEGYEKHFKEVFPGKYECDHDPKFTRETIKDAVWDIKEQKAVEL